MASSPRRNRCDDLVDLTQHRVVIDRIDGALEFFLDEQPNHRMGRNQVDLKLDMRGNLTPALEFGECRK
jgi:hypothetical protein